MKTSGKINILFVMIAAFTIVPLATEPAMAKSSKNVKNPAGQSSAAAADKTTSSVPEKTSDMQAKPHDTNPGPAWKTIGGKVKRINGDTYTVEDYEGNQVQLYVGEGTKHINRKRVGDPVRAEITRGGFANSIQ